MPPDETWDPLPDEEAAATIAAALSAVGYSEDSVTDLLGEDGVAAGVAEVAVFDRRLPGSELATVIRLLLLQLPVRLPDAVDALGGEAVDALAAVGLVRPGRKRLEPRARLVPVEGLYLAFDAFPGGADDPPGYVASFSPTASWCASLTPRRRVARALDVGTGNGAQALLAARHSGHVVATDINPRALAYTTFNAALNGLRNVETRLGSLFDPVEGERFDLVTCNAPYVVSPETRWQYRDGGLPADELSARVVTGAAGALADDGYATLLVSWLAESEDEPDERLFDWLDDSGCDAWVLGLSSTDPLEHAAGWNDHLSGDLESYGAALDDWTAYFRRLGFGWITEGGVLLHRRDGPEHRLRADPVEEDDLHLAGEQIERAFAAQAFLARGGALVEERLLPAEAVRLEHTIEARTGRRETMILLDEGTCPELVVEPAIGDLVASLDGRRTLGEAIDETARDLRLTGRRRASFERDARGAVQELFELGFFEYR
jgi:methylase of polypeptide subunit release factors